VALVGDNAMNKLYQDKKRARFSRLLRHLARRWSGSILTSPEPAQGNHKTKRCTYF